MINIVAATGDSQAYLVVFLIAFSLEGIVVMLHPTNGKAKQKTMERAPVLLCNMYILTFNNLQPHLDVVFLPLWKKLLFSFSGIFYESATLSPLLPNYHRNCDFDQYIWTCYEWFAPIRHVARFPALFTWWLFRFYFLTSFLLLLQPATRLGMTYCVYIYIFDGSPLFALSLASALRAQNTRSARL